MTLARALTEGEDFTVTAELKQVRLTRAGRRRLAALSMNAWPFWQSTSRTEEFVTLPLQAMKNRVLLENYYLPGDLERQIGAFVEYYNTQRSHESLGNITPADVYFGRDKAIIPEREKIKKLTIQNRRLQHQKQAV